MSKEQFEQKKAFVTRELSRCIAASHEGVDRLEYEYHDSGDECVVIRFASGYHKSVNTTGDSLHSILLDVLRALAEV